ncbi:Uma2 family endonuclease [Nostoc sp.]|uniref:Uma2 family endonuclease n=1 Tax=Nostoc sp. TaxID=1180 RepID=UPI002FF9CC21
MTTAVDKLTLVEYLAYDDGTDVKYELVDGELVEMPPESDRNNLISLYLLSQFLKFVPIQLIRHKDTELVVIGNRTRVRLPDLMILTQELLEAIAGGRATITPDMPPPVMVVEVVSPGKVNEDRDYRYKRSEYAARGIPEYWIVDATQARITLLTLVDGLYEEAVFQGTDVIKSVTFPMLNLTAAQVLTPGQNIPNP